MMTRGPQRRSGVERRVADIGPAEFLGGSPRVGMSHVQIEGAPQRMMLLSGARRAAAIRQTPAAASFCIPSDNVGVPLITVPSTPISPP